MMAIKGINAKYDITGDVIDVLFDHPEVFPIVGIIQAGTKNKDEALFYLRYSTGISETYDTVNKTATEFYGDNWPKKRLYIVREMLCRYACEFSSEKIAEVQVNATLANFLEKYGFND